MASCALLLLAGLAAPGSLRAEAPAAAVQGFDTYVRTVEARLAQQHDSSAHFLVAEDESRLRGGGWAIEDLTPARTGHLPGALLHHWRGTAFVAGATAAECERLMRDFAGYPQVYAPEVLTTSVAAQNGNRYHVQMRVRQRHGITVTLDSTYDVTFGALDARDGFSVSRSSEIHEAGSSHDHGFLWRQNTYWSWAARDGGLWIQVESVSLTRSIPTGLGWLIGPYIESIPRESLAFTLRATCDALRSGLAKKQATLEGRRP